MKQFVPGRRGLIAVRADAEDPKAVFASLRQAVEEFQTEVNAELKALKKGQEDVVRTEKIERINASITEMENTLTELNRTIAALRVGGGGGEGTSEAERAYTAAFQTFFRRGEDRVQGDLGQMAVQANLATDSNPDGGYVVPTEMANTIDRVARTVSNIRALSSVMSIGAPSYTKLVNMGGAGAGWVGERDERPETATPELRRLILETKELYANPAATQTLLDDANIDIGAWLADEVAEKFAEQENEAFFTGNGTSQPRGLLDYPLVANGSYTWGKIGFVKSGKSDGFLVPTTTVSPADAFIDLLYALKQQYRNGATFLMSDATLGTVRKFKDGDGTFLYSPPSGPEGVATILGKPVVTDDFMPAVDSNTYPVLFGNFARAYLIVDRFGIRVLRDPFTNKPYVHFYTTKRVGGGVVNFEAIKAMKIAA